MSFLPVPIGKPFKRQTRGYLVDVDQKQDSMANAEALASGALATPGYFMSVKGADGSWSLYVQQEDNTLVPASSGKGVLVLNTSAELAAIINPVANTIAYVHETASLYIYNATTAVWDVISGGDVVISINGLTGDVTLDATNLMYGTETLAEILDRTAKLDEVNTFTQDQILDTGALLLGTTNDGTQYNLIEMGVYISGAIEYDQIEVGSEHVHLNLNSIDRPTVEGPTEKEYVAYVSDLPLYQLDNIIHIMPEGDDSSADGTTLKPFRSLQAAIDFFDTASKKIFLIYPGVAGEYGRATVEKNNVIIKGIDRQLCEVELILRGLVNFRIENSKVKIVEIQSDSVNPFRLTIQNCIL